MREGLTARQTQILKSLIDEYIDTASPIGSESLEKKYNLGISPATVRNEMVLLTKSGYLKQPHTSAGRVPTPKAMRFYINQLMEEKQLSVTDEVKAKEKVWDAREDIEQLLEEATRALAETTNNLAIGALDTGKVCYSGCANIFKKPEFQNFQICIDLFEFLEETQRVNDLFFKMVTFESPVEVLFGEELGWPELESLNFVATRFKTKSAMGALGVVGPTRIRYPVVIPTLRYFGNLIEGFY